MSVSIDAMTDAENAAHAANKPLMLATNNSSIITTASSGWHPSTTSGSNETNVSVVTNAKVRGFDRIAGLTVSSTMASLSSTSSATSPTFRLQFSSSVIFDTVVIMGHNFGSVTNSGSSITAQIVASDSTATKVVSDTLTIASGDNSRLVFTHLYDASGSKPTFPKRVTISGASTNRVQLKLSNVRGDTSIKPALGEMWVGRRRQLLHNPNLPFDDKSETGMVSDFSSKSGLTQRYTYHQGKALRTINKSVTDSAELSSIESAFDDSDGFTKPIIWLENPAATSPDAYLMLPESPTLSLPLQGPIERVFSTSLIEQPPFKSSGS